MARHLVVPRLQDRFGNALHYGEIRLFEAGTPTEIEGYDAKVGGSQLTYPLGTGLDGSVDVWTEFEGDVDVVYTDGGLTVNARGQRCSFDEFTETRRVGPPAAGDFLPTAGGTMTGDIKVAATVGLGIGIAGQTGEWFSVYEDSPGDPAFRFQRPDGSAWVQIDPDDGGMYLFTPASMAFQATDRLEFFVGTRIDFNGAVVTNPSNPTLGAHIGNRDYNDARYMTRNPGTLADDSWTGQQLTGQAGEALAIGNICRFNSAGRLVKANASAIGTAGAVAIALGTIANNATGTFGMATGFMRDDSAYNFTVGGLIYLDTTSGGVTQSAPSTSGQVVQVLGVARSADIWLFQPSLAMTVVP